MTQHLSQAVLLVENRLVGWFLLYPVTTKITEIATNALKTQAAMHESERKSDRAFQVTELTVCLELLL